MPKHGKKYKEAHERIERGQDLPIKDALNKIKDTAYAAFDESIDVDVNLGIDPSKGDQTVRGSVVLPHGRGKVPRIIVFAKGEYADQAEQAGADIVGAEDLIEKIQKGWMDFDYAIAIPDLMGAVGKLAKQLGPRGLLPNKKLGTVTFDVASIVSELKQGRAFFKNDKQGIIHFSVGRKSFDVEKLNENIQAFFKALLAAKPPTSKGKYIKKVSISSTMGPSVSINSEGVIP